MKKNLSFDPNVIKPRHMMSNYEFYKLRTPLFTKYFPKYLKTFELLSKKAPVKSKVKRVKIIRNFKASMLEESPEWRLLLSNKIKFFKSLSNNTQNPIQFIEKIKLFTQLRSIQMSFSDSFVPISLKRNRTKVYSEAKVWKKIQRLRHIKNLIIYQFATAGEGLIRDLNAATRLLRSLKTFKLNINRFAKNTTGQLLHTTKNSKNLLKHFTNLQLSTLDSPSNFKDFQSLQDSCPNLVNLSFEFSCRTRSFHPRKGIKYSSEPFPVEVNFLETLKSFHSLKMLTLEIADTFTFLNDFVAPPLVQNLTLNIEECLTKEILLRIDSAFTDAQAFEFFEENQTLVKFYNNFQRLSHLETLKGIFSPNSNPENYRYQNYLLQNILKAIPSLKRIAFADGFHDNGLNQRCELPMRDLYLPQLLNSCHYFSHILENLEIGGYGEIIFSNFDFSSSKNKFTNLSTIKFTGRFVDPNLDIAPCLEQIISLGDSMTTIKLNTFIHSTTKSLLALLQQLSKVKRPPNLKVELQIKFLGYKRPEQLEFDLQDLAKELPESLELQGISLNIVTTENYSEYVKEALIIYGKKFDNFNIRSDSVQF